MCVCTQYEAMPAATGSAQDPPAVISQHRKSRRPNGSTVIDGFHGSRRKSAPNARASTPHPTRVKSMRGVPPRRLATSAMPAMAAPLISSAPTFTPIEAPPVSR